jgi:predicted Zn-dependent protease
MKNWNLDQLKKELNSRANIFGWMIHVDHTHRRERYFMKDGKTLVADQDRNVHQQSISARILVDIGQAGRHGEIQKKFFPAFPLGPQIESAIEAAVQTDHQSWNLPKEVPSKIPARKSADPKMAEDLEGSMQKLTSQIAAAVSKPRNTVFNSSELFLSVHDRELHLSNGLTHRSSQSRVYVEAAFSFEKKGKDGKPHSDEYLSTRWAVSLDELDVNKLFDETSDRAEASLDVAKPVTGKYPVIVDADVLATVFNDHLSQMTAVHAYQGLPFLKPGEEMIPQAKGDLLTITLDPSLDCGADTTALSDQGVIQEPLKLVDQNRVVSTISDVQYSHYLSKAPTTARGNLVIPGGKLDYQELTKQGPQVVEILQFSGLFVDPNSGTFSSEIRLAKLHDNQTGKVTYLKGGSLSGSISENFRNARYSSTQVRRAHFSSNQPHGHGYFGPEFALLNDVSIVG